VSGYDAGINVFSVSDEMLRVMEQTGRQQVDCSRAAGQQQQAIADSDKSRQAGGDVRAIGPGFVRWIFLEWGGGNFSEREGERVLICIMAVCQKGTMPINAGDQTTKITKLQVQQRSTKSSSTVINT